LETKSQQHTLAIHRGAMKELIRVMQQQASDSKQFFVPLWSITIQNQHQQKNSSCNKCTASMKNLKFIMLKNSELMNSVAYRIISKFVLHSTDTSHVK